jgi:hypothetical protein
VVCANAVSGVAHSSRIKELRTMLPGEKPAKEICVVIDSGAKPAPHVLTRCHPNCDDLAEIENVPRKSKNNSFPAGISSWRFNLLKKPTARNILMHRSDGLESVCTHPSLPYPITPFNPDSAFATHRSARSQSRPYGMSSAFGATFGARRKYLSIIGSLDVPEIGWIPDTDANRRPFNGSPTFGR